MNKNMFKTIMASAAILLIAGVPCAHAATSGYVSAQLKLDELIFTTEDNSGNTADYEAGTDYTYAPGYVMPNASQQQYGFSVNQRNLVGDPLRLYEFEEEIEHGTFENGYNVYAETAVPGSLPNAHSHIEVNDFFGGIYTESEINVPGDDIYWASADARGDYLMVVEILNSADITAHLSPRFITQDLQLDNSEDDLAIQLSALMYGVPYIDVNNVWQPDATRDIYASAYHRIYTENGDPLPAADEDFYADLIFDASVTQGEIWLFQFQASARIIGEATAAPAGDPVPEPGTIALIGMSLVGFWYWKRPY